MRFGRADLVAAAIVVLVAAAHAAPVRAQSADASPASRPDDGPRTQPTRLYLGMWTKHLKDRDRPIDSNWLVGVSFRGIYGGTFRNSFGRRAYAAGLQRTFATASRGPFEGSLGFRVGLVSGYDGRFMRIARDVPVLPMAQVFVNLDYHRVGVEVSYTILVTSLAMSYRF
jgi:hypothetical protein